MPEEKKKYSALFDYDSFIIRILPSERSLDQETASIDILTAYNLITSSIYSNYNRDSYSFQINDKLPLEAKEVLTHETFHWWQALSSTFYISRFLLNLKLIRCNVSENGLKEIFITDTFIDEKKDTIESLYKSSLSNFFDYSIQKDELSELERALLLCKKDFNLNERDQVIKKFKNLCYGEGLEVYNRLYGENRSSFNIISDDPPTAMPYFDFPHLDEGVSLPGYCAILDYFYYIDFSGLKIIESATYISELLFQKKSIPEIDFSNIEDHTYLGVWEFYRRLHSHRYKNQEDLALSFLALVDLVFLNDPEIKESEIFDIDEKYVNSSLPYRFGKIVYRAQGVPPLDFSSCNYEIAVKNFQDSFCEYTGMPNPETGIKRMIVYLIRVLCWDARFYLEEEERAIINDLYVRLYEKLNENWNTTFTIIDFLNKARKRVEGKANLGYDIIGLIINALYFRLNNRGKFAFPHVYFSELKNALPLPLVIFNSDYYVDMDGLLIGYKNPCEIDYSEINHDFLILKTLSPLCDNQVKCGFLKNYIKCQFQKNGARCPHSNIKDENKLSVQNLYNPDGGCHWSYVLSNFRKEN